MMSLPSGKYCARKTSPSSSILHVATCLPLATTLVGALALPNEQMTPQVFDVGPIPSLPSSRMLFAATPNDVLLLTLGARSKQTENERGWPGLNPGPLVIGALAKG